MGVTTQVRLYPLGQASLAPAIDEALPVFREHELDVKTVAMSTLVVGKDTAVFSAVQEVLCRAAEQASMLMIATFSNACPVPRKGNDNGTVTYRAIGHVGNDSKGQRRQVFYAASNLGLCLT